MDDILTGIERFLGLSFCENLREDKSQIYRIEVSVDEINLIRLKKQHGLEVTVKFFNIAELLTEYKTLQTYEESEVEGVSSSAECGESKNSESEPKDKSITGAENGADGTVSAADDDLKTGKESETNNTKNSETLVEDESTTRIDTEVDNETKSTESVADDGSTSTKESETSEEDREESLYEDSSLCLSGPIGEFDGQIIKRGVSLVVLRKPTDLIHLMQLFFLEVKIDFYNGFMKCPVGRANLKMGPLFWQLVCLSRAGIFKSTATNALAPIRTEDGKLAGNVSSTIRLICFPDKNITELQLSPANKPKEEEMAGEKEKEEDTDLVEEDKDETEIEENDELKGSEHGNEEAMIEEESDEVRNPHLNYVPTLETKLGIIEQYDEMQILDSYLELCKKDTYSCKTYISDEVNCKQI